MQECTLVLGNRRVAGLVVVTELSDGGVTLRTQVDGEVTDILIDYDHFADRLPALSVRDICRIDFVVRGCILVILSLDVCGRAVTKYGHKESEHVH